MKKGSASPGGVKTRREAEPARTRTNRAKTFVKRLLTAAAGLPGATTERLFGFDLFVSYSRKSSKDYARRLWTSLETKGLKAFLDESDFASGASLPVETERAVRSSSALILVFDKQTLASVFVRDEVSRFRRAGKLIIPLDRDGTLRAIRSCPEARTKFAAALALDDDALSLLDFLCEELIAVEEATAGVDAPSEAVLRKIVGSLQIVRRSVHRTRVVTAAAAALCGLSTASGVLWYEEQTARQVAEARLRVSESQRLAAQSRQALVTDPHEAARKARAARAALLPQDGQVREVRQTVTSVLAQLPDRCRDTEGMVTGINPILGHTWSFAANALCLDQRNVGSRSTLPLPPLLDPQWPRVGIAMDAPIALAATKDGAHLVEYRDGELHGRDVALPLEDHEIALATRGDWIEVIQERTVGFVKPADAPGRSALVRAVPNDAIAALSDNGPTIARPTDAGWVVERVADQTHEPVATLAIEATAQPATLSPSCNCFACVTHADAHPTLAIFDYAQRDRVAAANLRLPADAKDLVFLHSDHLLVLFENQPTRMLSPGSESLQEVPLDWSPYTAERLGDGSGRLLLLDASRNQAAMVSSTAGEIRFATFSSDSEHQIDMCAVSPDGAWIVTASGDQFTRAPVIHVRSKDAKGDYGTAYPVRGLRSLAIRVAIDNGGRLMAAGIGGEVVEFWLGHRDAVTALAPLSNGRFLSGGQDGRVLAWHEHASETLLEQSMPIQAIVVSPDQTAFAILSGDEKAHEVHIRTTGAPDVAFASERIETQPLWLGWWNDPKAFASVDRAGTLTLRDPVTGTTIEQTSLGSRINEVTVSASGTCLAWHNDDDRLGMTRRTANGLRHTVGNRMENLRQLSFLDDERLLTGNQQGQLLCWNTAGDLALSNPLEVQRDVGFTYAIGCSPDAEHVAAVAQGPWIHQWRMHGDEFVHGEPLSAHQGQTGSLLFSKRPGWLASANSALGMPPWDMTVRLWPYDEHGVRSSYLELTHDALVSELAFLDQPRALVTATHAGRVLYWPLDSSGIDAALDRRVLPPR